MLAVLLSPLRRKYGDHDGIESTSNDLLILVGSHKRLVPVCERLTWSSRSADLSTVKSEMMTYEGGWTLLASQMQTDAKFVSGPLLLSSRKCPKGPLQGYL